MRRGCRVDHQTFCVAHVRPVRKQLESLDKAPARIEPSLDAEREDSAGAKRKVALRQAAIAAGCQTRIIDPRYPVMEFEKLCHGKSVFRMALHAELQRFQSLQEQERVERAERRAKVPQPFDARLHDVREISECFVKPDAVVALARLEYLREAALVPREAAAIDDASADRSAVTTDELRCRMHHDVSSVLDWPAEVRGSEGVVDNQRKVMLMRDGRHRGDVQHIHSRVADRSEERRVGKECRSRWA